jgi:hypothetical protein
MAHADGYVLPKPEVPKTLGILNVIFGVMLILFGICTVGSTFLSPLLFGSMQQMQKDQQASLEARHQSRLQELEAREKAAPTEAEKKAVRDEKDVLTANPPKIPAIDVNDSVALLKDPSFRAFTIAQVGTSLVMNGLLIASGIGLIRLRSWARSLALWLSGLQIVRLSIITAGSLLVMAPIQKPFADRAIAKLEAEARQPGAPPTVDFTLRLTKVMQSLAPAMTGIYLVGGSIFPVVSLILLNSAGARAACQARKPEGAAGF